MLWTCASSCQAGLSVLFSRLRPQRRVTSSSLGGSHGGAPLSPIRDEDGNARDGGDVRPLMYGSGALEDLLPPIDEADALPDADALFDMGVGPFSLTGP